MIWRCAAPKKIYYSKGYCSNHSTAISSFPRFNLKAINYKRLMPCPTTSCHEPTVSGKETRKRKRGKRARLHFSNRLAATSYFLLQNSVQTALLGKKIKNCFTYAKVKMGLPSCYWSSFLRFDQGSAFVKKKKKIPKCWKLRVPYSSRTKRGDANWHATALGLCLMTLRRGKGTVWWMPGPRLHCTTCMLGSQLSQGSLPAPKSWSRKKEPLFRPFSSSCSVKGYNRKNSGPRVSSLLH